MQPKAKDQRNLRRPLKNSVITARTSVTVVKLKVTLLETVRTSRPKL